MEITSRGKRDENATLRTLILGGYDPEDGLVADKEVILILRCMYTKEGTQPKYFLALVNYYFGSAFNTHIHLLIVVPLLLTSIAILTVKDVKIRARIWCFWGDRVVFH